MSHFGLQTRQEKKKREEEEEGEEEEEESDQAKVWMHDFGIELHGILV